MPSVWYNCNRGKMTRLAGLILASSLLGGCATARNFVDFYKPRAVPPTPNYQQMTYMEILNYEMHQKYPSPRRKGNRMLLIFGKVSETVKMLGAKIVWKF